MGLGITVGLLADLLLNDPDQAHEARQPFALLAQAMAGAGLPPHVEPETCEVWGADGYGYTGLHALREVAGLVWRALPVPTDQILTGEATPHADALFATAVAACAPDKHQSLLSRILGEKPPARPSLPPFSHLLLHSDADGFYVPVDFAQPLIPLPPPPDSESLWPLGSVQRLAAELDALGRALDLPADLPDPDDVLETWFEAKTPVTALWQAQPIATHSLIILRQACTQSLRTGAAIAFG